MSARAGELPWWADFLLLPVLNLALAFFVSGLVLWGLGESPIECVQIMLTGAFGTSAGIGYTLFYATNFIFSGLAFAVAFHAGLFNIGVEGQAYVAGLGVAMASLGLEFLPQLLIILIAVILSAAFGAAWAFIPAILQAKRGSHLVITTIMFNFIASALMIYLLAGILKPAGEMAPQTRTFVEHARLPLFQDVFAAIGLPIGQSPLNLAFVWALLCAWAVAVLIWRTRLGYELRTLGASPDAAKYAGMKVTSLTVIALMISGALGGFMALNEVMGSQNHLALEFTAGYGFVGIAVALMGRSRSLGIVIAAVLFGALYQGGTELAFEKPSITSDMIVLVQGLVILTAGALEHMFRPALARLFAGRASAALVAQEA
jgi:general nucleoside transport system permease protein